MIDIAPPLLDHLAHSQPFQAVSPLELLQTFERRPDSFSIPLPERNQFGHRVLVLRDHESFALLHAPKRLWQMLFSLERANFRHGQSLLRTERCVVDGNLLTSRGR